MQELEKIVFNFNNDITRFLTINTDVETYGVFVGKEKDLEASCPQINKSRSREKGVDICHGMNRMLIRKDTKDHDQIGFVKTIVQ